MDSVMQDIMQTAKTLELLEIASNFKCHTIRIDAYSETEYGSFTLFHEHGHILDFNVHQTIAKKLKMPGFSLRNGSFVCQKDILDSGTWIYKNNEWVKQGG